MPENGRLRRTLARLSQNGSSSTHYNGKRPYNVSQQPSTTKSKRRKVETKTKEDRLADVIVDFNLAVNELYQLKEYKSLLSWDPQENSNANSKTIKVELDEFIKENKYKLTWNDEIENSSDIDSLPFRFQKKKLAEQERSLDEKYPFRQEVLANCREMEEHLIKKLDQEEILPQPSVKVKGKPGPKPKTQHKTSAPDKPDRRKGRQAKAEVRESEDQEEEQDESEEEVNNEDEEEEEEEDEQGTDDVQDNEIEELEKSETPVPEMNHRIKSIRRTIPLPIVTHPSHIPKWRPEHQGGNSHIQGSNDDEDKIISFDPTPLTIVQTRQETLVAPELTSKLRRFLDNDFKTPIIDEGNMPDYNFTSDEYNTIMSQHEELLQKLTYKIYVEKSLQLNGDKIEQRKVVLPQSNIKLTDPFRNTSSVTPKIQGIANNATHQDHLLAQGISFSKVHQQMRKQHQLRTRKVATMIEQHFKKKRGEKERLAKEREQNLKKISRLTMQAVKKRWNQAYKVYQVMQNEKEEELKKIKGRQHLSEMLEHSTQLLEAQLTSSREATAEPESIHSLSGDERESIDSDDFMSSDEDEEEHANGSKLNGHSREEDNDMKLSVEELRKKYANLEDSLEPVSSNLTSERELGSESEDDDLGSSDEEDDGTDVSRGLAALYGVDEVSQSPAPSLEYTQEEKTLIEQINQDGDGELNSVLDSDSEGSLSDSESLGSEEKSANEEDDEPITQNGSSLAGLFSGNAGDSDDDEEVDGDAEIPSEQSEFDSDENMSSSEDEEHSAQTNGLMDKRLTQVASEDDDSQIEVINGSKVRDVPLPSLLRGTLRPYQKQGLNWLASLYNNNTNGILADEMGLGKTIQTISLLSYLACEHHIWGPHLIIVPTSVMLNWEMEFKKFAPGFKVLTYYGSPQQRAQKRKGWNKPDAFHVCITSYQLVVQDQQSFKRRRWRYMILDEAHNIKNFRSTRWRALLNFNTENRLLLTGTPLQNNLMELWSLLYFLMPSSKVNQAMPEGFANLDDFQQWFGKPVDKILEQTTAGNTDLIDENERATQKMDEETRNTVARLHQVLRPYLLRRLKKDVEKQMPGKYEHIVYCRLSKRQRYLYDDFMSRAKTKETLASGNFLSIINCLMQLRKVCNHPDLFEVRPIVTSFAMPRSIPSFYQLTDQLINKQFEAKEEINFNVLNLDVTSCEDMNYFVSQSSRILKSSEPLQEQINQLAELESGLEKADPTNHVNYYQHLKLEDQMEVKEKLKQALYLNTLRCERKPIYGNSLLKFLTLKPRDYTDEPFNKYCLSISERAAQMDDTIEKYSIITPAVVALDMKDQLIPISTRRRVIKDIAENNVENPFHKAQVKLSIAFPDKSLLQYDCGKLQRLATLLQDLTSQGHRALIFTQMTKVLDILEQFLNIHGYRYMRLDGATKIEDRQLLTEKFNRDPKIPVFILSTRSGGLGINLTGADTVIFYDSDWNPAMDKQCQDRCHRIGQVRDVHIYRFVSEYTIESNIIKKANQKRQLDNVVIQEGEFTTDYFGKFSVRDLVSDTTTIANEITDRTIDFSGDAKMGNVFAQAEDEEDRVAAGAALKEVAIDDDDFKDETKSATAGATPAPGDANANAMVGIDGDGGFVDVDFDEGIGHIDEYMLRFISDGYY
ncbi:Helicase SWR1 [Candida viswanathii]|uniref:Helicase SWR1 n=1 Tax=Candida viswanathii TaxID=5486 RepID=A0A367XQ84_9ASCO|nr:Helicase SWR1 [Candida viswanathii]